MYKVSAISYLNTAPFNYGLKRSPLLSQIEISYDIPAVCADKLLSGSVDVGIVPVAILPEMADPYIITDYCIGASSEVKSVLLVSNSPLEEVKRVYLDYQSRTSVLLTQVLSYHHWKLNAEFIFTETDAELLNPGHAGASVIIGDRALQYGDCFVYQYDLAVEWRKFCGLPFVFACWVANKKLPDDFIRQFNSALKHGIDHIDEVIKEKQAEFPGIDVSSYLKNNIDYRLDDEKREGMSLFLKYISYYKS